MSSAFVEQPSMCQGEKQEIKNGLYQFQENLEGGEKQLVLWNSASDLQFKVTMEFQAPEIELLGDTLLEGTKYIVSLYPGEAKPFVKGKWKASKRNLGFGAPDKAWQTAQAGKLNAEMEKRIQLVEDYVAKDLGVDPKVDCVNKFLADVSSDGKVDAEAIAQVCVNHGSPFVDLAFPPTQLSLARPHELQLPVYAWMRPSAYCDEENPACLYVGEIEPNDIDQGMLGDCYFMCALACISEFPDLIKHIYDLPQNPELGIFRAFICKDGWWRFVTIDDSLPINPATMLPVFAKNREEPNELWVSFLEKVYAKCHGSYATIKSGDPAMAVADMVGGPYERFNKRPEWEDKEKMFDFLMMCDEADHIMCLGTPGVDVSDYAGGTGGPNALSDSYQKVGLCTGHAFSLIRVKRSHGNKLCMIRNPWGNDMEWNGDWSDDSDKWTDEIKKEVGFYKGDDGTFWMNWEDVCQWFTTGSVTYVLSGWSHARVKFAFDKGVPTVIAKLTISGTSPVRFWFGAHQRDNRGLKPDDPEAKYAGTLISILTPDPANPKRSKKAGGSGGGAFQMGRDVFAEETLAPSDQPYYVLLQTYNDENKAIKLSIFCESHKNVRIDFVAYNTAEDKKKYNPVSKFDPTTATAPAPKDTPYQVVTDDTVIPVELTGTKVEWNQPRPAKKECLKPADPKVAEEGRKKLLELFPPKARNIQSPSQGGATATVAPEKMELGTAPPAKKSEQEVKPATQAPPGATTKSSPSATSSSPPKPKVEEKREEIIKMIDPNALVLSGWLQKYSTGRNKGVLSGILGSNWKKRFFRLKGDGTLSYYEGEAIDSKCLHVLQLGTGGTTRVIGEAGKEDHSAADLNENDFAVSFTESDGQLLMLLLRSEKPDERTKWVTALRSVVAQQKK